MHKGVAQKLRKSVENRCCPRYLEPTDRARRAQYFQLCTPVIHYVKKEGVASPRCFRSSMEWIIYVDCTCSFLSPGPLATRSLTPFRLERASALFPGLSNYVHTCLGERLRDLVSVCTCMGMYRKSYDVIPATGPSWFLPWLPRQRQKNRKRAGGPGPEETNRGKRSRVIKRRHRLSVWRGKLDVHNSHGFSFSELLL